MELMLLLDVLGMFVYVYKCVLRQFSEWYRFR